MFQQRQQPKHTNTKPNTIQHNDCLYDIQTMM